LIDAIKEGDICELFPPQIFFVCNKRDVRTIMDDAAVEYDEDADPSGEVWTNLVANAWQQKKEYCDKQLRYKLFEWQDTAEPTQADLHPTGQPQERNSSLARGLVERDNIRMTILSTQDANPTGRQSVSRMGNPNWPYGPYSPFVFFLEGLVDFLVESQNKFMSCLDEQLRSSILRFVRNFIENNKTADTLREEMRELAGSVRAFLTDLESDLREVAETHGKRLLHERIEEVRERMLDKVRDVTSTHSAQT
jgi:hypothetical protein